MFQCKTVDILINQRSVELFANQELYINQRVECHFGNMRLQSWTWNGQAQSGSAGDANLDELAARLASVYINNTERSENLA